ncbi:MAG: putative serine protease [Betaproteobacteria bacterium]|nr:putative serine protease [Betaproteobacteria bacterium]
MTYLASLLRLRRIRGALISHIGTDSPAEKAGLEIGDVIIRFAGKKIKNSAELKKYVDASCGNDANVEVVRNGRKKSFVVTIEKPPSGGTPTGQSKPGD